MTPIENAEWKVVFAHARVKRAIEMAARACANGDYDLADQWVGHFKAALTQLRKAEAKFTALSASMARKEA